MKPSHIPMRVATGAYILLGPSKQGPEGQATEGMHAMAAGATPTVKTIPATRFASSCRPPRSRSAERCWLRSSPPEIAGAATAGFSAVLIQPVPEDPGDAARGQLQVHTGWRRPGQRTCGCSAAD